MAEKSYARLLTRLHNAPILMHEDKLRIITEAVTLPLLYGKADTIDRTPAQTNATKREFASAFEQNGRKLAIISAFDSLVSKDVNAASGMSSYESINQTIDNAIAAGVTDIGFYIDSPGGEATGLFGLTEKIRSLPSRGISTFSFADNATSAAYAIASATQKIYASEIASVGSIAALMVHAETSKKADSNGVTYTIFRSKELKALGDSLTPLSEAAKEKFTSSLEILDTAFNNDVVKGRSQLSVQDIIAMKGASFSAGEGLNLKLVDKIVPNLETALSDFLKQPKQTSNKGVKMSDEAKDLQVKLAETEAKLAQFEASAATQTVAMQEAVTKAVAEERQRAVTILSTSKTLKIGFDTALSHVEKGHSTEMSLEIMTAVAEATDSAKHIDGSHEAASASADEGAGKDSASRIAMMKAAYKAQLGLA